MTTAHKTHEHRPHKAGERLTAFKSVMIDTGKQIQEAQLPQAASSLAYTTILSIIPLLAMSFSIFQAFGGMEKLYGTIEPLIIENLAEGSSEEAIQAIRKFIGNIHAGTLGASGLVGLIITSMTMLASIEKAINRIWKTPMTRSLFQRISSYWLFITLGPLGMGVAIGAATGSELSLAKILPSGAGLFIIVTFVFFSIYKWVPHRKVHWIPALTSAVLTALLWNLARLGYALYTKQVVTYNKIYGSLAAIPILLLWIYIIWLIVLSGAAFSAAFQKRFDFK